MSPRTTTYFKLVGVQRPPAGADRGAPGILAAGHSAQRSLGISLKSGLRDVVDLPHAIPAGASPFLAIDSNRCIYVWFDAVINYLTATGWPENAVWDTGLARRCASGRQRDLHALPCDALARHAAGPRPAPALSTVLGHGWWLIGGEKGSKSKGNIPTPQEVVAEIVAQSGANEEAAKDALRYYLLRDISFTSDAEFSVDNLIEKRYNPELMQQAGQSAEPDAENAGPVRAGGRAERRCRTDCRRASWRRCPAKPRRMSERFDACALDPAAALWRRFGS